MARAESAPLPPSRPYCVLCTHPVDEIAADDEQIGEAVRNLRLNVGIQNGVEVAHLGCAIDHEHSERRDRAGNTRGA